ncbi:MAG: beta/gamma crystallin family protein [Betaproteobacteria bacterium]|jgi:hypothetical protein|nr:beta/gamma crystallin family protein [Betaproteobacteria bacterium]
MPVSAGARPSGARDETADAEIWDVRRFGIGADGVNGAIPSQWRNTTMKMAHFCSFAGIAACLTAGSALAQVALYENDNFGGRVYRSSSAVPNLHHTGFNDKASSVVVQNGRWQLCSDAGFRGNCVTLDPGVYPSLAAMGMNDKVSSVQELGGRPAPGYGGNNQWGGNAYDPQSTTKLTTKDTGHCRLIHVAMGRDLYNGLCSMKQTVDGNQNKFTFRMGNAQPYVFVSRGGGWEFVSPMGGAEPARFKDLGHNAVFRWGDYRLEVDEDL